MSLEKIKAMAEVAQQMESMKNEIIKENSKGRIQSQIEALYKIQDYFKDLAKSLNGTVVSVRIPVHIYWLNKGEEFKNKYYKLGISFNKDGEVQLSENANSSYLLIKNFTNQTETDFYYKDSEGITWNDGYIQLIEQWDKIKPLLEDEIQNELLKKMNESQKELIDFKESYEKVNDFEA